MQSNRQVLVSCCLLSDRLYLCFFFLFCSVPFLSVSPSSGVISGAITSQYLLEKSRIVFQVRLTEDDMPRFHPKYPRLNFPCTEGFHQPVDVCIYCRLKTYED